MRNALTLLFLAHAAVTVPAAAQQPGSCFRGRPATTCRSFWITEANGGVEWLGGKTNLYAAAEVGWMRNLGARTALGAGLAGGIAGDGGEFVSLRPRFRRWVTPTTALDVALGVRWTPGRVEIIEGLLSANLGDWAGVWAGGVADLGRSEIGWMAGVRAASYPGLVSYGVGAILAVLYVIALYPAD